MPTIAPRSAGSESTAEVKSRTGSGSSSRRTALLGALAAGGLGIAAVSSSRIDTADAAPAFQALIEPLSSAKGDPKIVPNISVNADPHWNLARKMTYTPNRNIVAEIKKRGYTKWVEDQLSQRVDNSYWQGIIDAVYPWYNLDNVELRKVSERYGFTAYGNFNNQMMLRTMVSRFTSKHQVFEMMVEFWRDQMHYSGAQSTAHAYTFDYDRRVRANALGTVADLLYVTLSSPAMMDYLNNNGSTKVAPNENLAREFLELHSMGVGNYTENDIKEIAKLLTGADLRYKQEHRGIKDHVVNPNNHYVGKISTSFGFSIANDVNTVDAYWANLKALCAFTANHPATAKRVCSRLIQRFVADEVDEGLLAQLISVYLSSKSDIKPVLRALLNHRLFKASSGTKWKRPIEFMGATYGIRLKSLSATPGWETDMSLLPGGRAWNGLIKKCAHQPYMWPAPNGYPIESGFWLNTNTLLAEWEMTLYATNIIPPDMPDMHSWYDLLGIKEGQNVWDVADNITDFFLGQRVDDNLRTKLAAMLNDRSPKVPAANATLKPSLDGKVFSAIRMFFMSPYMQLR